ncbi:MAG: ATP phosphoribosyltransferase [Candidatus Nanopelagicales bacterium]
MLRIAIPNKGQLAEPTQKLLREAGFLRSHHPRDLVVSDPENDIEFFFLRPRDVATYVGEGTLDFGITGNDLLIDSMSSANVMIELGFGKSTFRIAAEAKSGIKNFNDLENKKIATSYANLLSKWLIEQSIKSEIIKLDGAVENAIRLGVADAIADVVDTGTTMKQAGLNFIGDAISKSQAVLIKSKKLKESSEVETFMRRINSVLVAREYVMMDYDVEKNNLDKATVITPGFESPTISPLQETNWVAVRSMVKKSEVHKCMDELYKIGAKAIIVTEIMACRL